MIKMDLPIAKAIESNIFVLWLDGYVTEQEYFRIKNRVEKALIERTGMNLAGRRVDDEQ